MRLRKAIEQVALNEAAKQKYTGTFEKGRGPTGIAYTIPSGHPDAENPKTRKKYPERQTPQYKKEYKAILQKKAPRLVRDHPINEELEEAQGSTKVSIPFPKLKKVGKFKIGLAFPAPNTIYTIRFRNEEFFIAPSEVKDLIKILSQRDIVTKNPPGMAKLSEEVEFEDMTKLDESFKRFAGNKDIEVFQALDNENDDKPIYYRIFHKTNGEHHSSGESIHIPMNMVRQFKQLITKLK